MGQPYFAIQSVITPSDLEPVYVHLNHAQVFKHMERARVELLSFLGFPLDQMLKTGLSLVITNIDISYVREILDGPIKVTCEGGEIRGKDLVLYQQIFNARDKSAVRAKVTSACMSLETRRRADPPAGFIERFDRWFKSGE